MEFKKHNVGLNISTGQAELPKLKVRGWFGRDHDGKYTEDAKECVQFLHVPRSESVNFDLKYKHPNDEERDNGGHIDYIFLWIMQHSKDKHGKPVKPNERFISYRGNFKKILESAYATQIGWDVYCSRVKGNIYLLMEEFENGVHVNKMDMTDSDLPKPGLKLTESQMRNMESNGGLQKDYNTVLGLVSSISVGSPRYISPEEQKCSRYGRKFEQHLLSSTRNSNPDPRQPMTKYNDMSIVLSAKLHDHTMLYCGEADGVPLNADLEDLNSAQLYEIKTVRNNVNPRSLQRYKMLKFWSQYVFGRCDILLGYRDDNTGIARRVERLRGADISSRVGGIWDPIVCINFLMDVLNLIEKTVDAAPEETVFQFQWRPVEPRVLRSARLPPTKDGVSWVLPTFYRNWLKTTSN